MTNKNGPWTITHSEPKYSNQWISVREDRIIRIDGSPGVYGVVTTRPGASVLAMDAERNVYLARQFRYALQRESIEIFSGALEDGENSLEAAKRELQEESGFTSLRWTSLGMVDPISSTVIGPNHMFLAEHVTPGSRSLDGNEQIETVKMTFEAALRRTMDGEITHSVTVAAILKTRILLEARDGAH